MSPLLRRHALVSILTILLTLLGACAAPATPSQSEAEAQNQPQPTPTASPAAEATSARDVKNPDSIVYATAADIETLDPAWAYDTASATPIFNVYETLLFPQRDKTDTYVPLLASDWKISPDGTTYTFTIRDGITFHKGQDLTAEDVAYSFWRGMIQDRAGGPQWILLQPFFGLAVHTFKDDVVTGRFDGDWIAACEAIKEAISFDNGARTVTMQLKQPYGPLPQILAIPFTSIVSKPWVTEVGGWNGDCATAEQYNDPAAEESELFNTMNGTGPYTFDRWAPGEGWSLKRNDSYWLQTPLWTDSPSGPARVARVSTNVTEEWGTRFAMLQAGDADFADIPPQYYAQVDPLVAEACDYQTDACTPVNADGILRLYKDLPLVAASTIFFNQQVDTTDGNPSLGSGKLDGEGIPADFFADLHIRKAFNYCFDWQTFIQEVHQGEASQVAGPIISGHVGYNEKQPHYSLDLDQCAAEFKATELTAEDGTSLWDTGFVVQYVYPTGTEEWRAAGEILQANLAQVNPRFRIELVDQAWPAFLEAMNAGRMALFVLGWQEDFHDPHNWVTPYLASDGNYARLQHFEQDLQVEFDRLIEQGIEETDRAARAKIYEQLQNMAHEHAVDLFLVQGTGRYYGQTWLHDWYYNPTYPGPYFYALSKK